MPSLRNACSPRRSRWIGIVIRGHDTISKWIGTGLDWTGIADQKCPRHDSTEVICTHPFFHGNCTVIYGKRGVGPPPATPQFERSKWGKFCVNYSHFYHVLQFPSQTGKSKFKRKEKKKGHLSSPLIVRMVGPMC